MLVLYRNPFDREEKEVLPLPKEARTVRELLGDEAEPKEGLRWFVLVDGRIADLDASVARGQDVRCILVPAGGDFFRLALFAALTFSIPGLPLFGLPAGSLGAALLRTGYYLLGSTIINALVPIQGPPAARQVPPSYTFEGVGNTAQYGLPVPVLYGQHRVGGNVIALRTDGRGTTQLLHMLIALCEGEVEEVSDILLDGQPATAAGVPLVETLSKQSAGTSYAATELLLGYRPGSRNQSSITSDDIDFDDDLRQVNYTDGSAPGELIFAYGGKIGDQSGDGITGAVLVDKGADFEAAGVQAGDTFRMAPTIYYSEDYPLLANFTVVDAETIALKYGQVYWGGRRIAFYQPAAGKNLFGHYRARFYDMRNRTSVELQGVLATSEGDTNTGWLVRDVGQSFPTNQNDPWINRMFELYPDPSASETVTTVASVDSKTQLTLGTSGLAGVSGDYVITRPLTKQVTALPSYTKAWVTLLMPRGKGKVDKRGRLQSAITRVKVEYRPIGGGSWDTLPDGVGSAGSQVKDGVITFIGDSLAAWSETFRVHPAGGLAADQYEFRFTRLSIPPVGLQNERATEVRLSHITVASEASRAYERTAVLAVRSVANSNIQGRFPEVTALVKGRKVYDPRVGMLATGTASVVDNGDGTSTLTDGSADFAAAGVQAGDYVVLNGLRGDVSAVGTTTLTLGDTDLAGQTGTYKVFRLSWTDNPALIARDILLAALDPAGWADCLNPVQSRIDDTSMIDWANWCDEVISYGGQNEKRCRCDILIDEATTIWEALAMVAAAGRANIIQVGTTFRAVIDRPEAESMLLTAGDAIARSFQAEYMPVKERAQTVEVSFADRDNGFKRTLLYVPDQASAYKDKPVTIDARGVTRKGQAERHAKMMLYHNRIETKVITVDVGPVGLPVLVGDVIRLQHTAMNLGLGGRLLDYSEDGGYFVVIDQAADLEVGKAYELRVRQPDDTVAVRGVLNRGQGVQRLELDGSLNLAGGSASDCAYLLGEAASHSELVRVIGVDRDAEGRHRIAAVPYDASMYADIEDDSVDAASAQGQRLQVARHVANVAATYVFETENTLRVNVFWQPDDTEDTAYYGAEVFVRVGASTWESYGRTTGTAKVIMPRAVPGESLTIKVCALRRDGGLLSFGDAPEAFLVVGRNDENTPIGDVQNFLAARSGPSVYLSWDAVEHPHFAYYEVRRGDSWANGVVVAVVAEPSVVTAYPDAATFWVKAVDSYGVESVNAASASVGAYSGSSVIDQSEEPTWGGTKTDCSVVSESLRANSERPWGRPETEHDFEYITAEIDAGSSASGAVTVDVGVASEDSAMTVAAMLEPVSAYDLQNGWTVLGNSTGMRVRVFVASSDTSGFTPSWQELVQGGTYGPARYWRFRLLVYSVEGARGIITRMRSRLT